MIFLSYNKMLSVLNFFIFNIFYFCFFFFSILPTLPIYAFNSIPIEQTEQINRKEKEKKLFLSNCITCHANGNNIIIPEKSLKKEALQENGMDNKNAIIYQIMNGKNGMPAFGGRLKEMEIEAIANYVLENCDSFGS